MGGSSSRGILAAHQPLVVPMLLRLSNFRLNAYVVLVVSKQKGITLVFKTDPLQNVDVNSTFDSIAVIQKFIQREIEGQLREMFREDLPAIIHRLSQRWTAGRTKVEAPYLHHNPTTLPREKTYTNQTPSEPTPPRLPHIQATGPGYGFPQVGLRQVFIPRPLSLSHLPISRPRVSPAPSARSHASKPPKPPSPPPLEHSSSFPDIENYDPTYGLRPEGLPTKSNYSGFGKLFTGNKGLADLGEEPVEQDDGATAFDVVDWEDAVPDYSTNPPSDAGPESDTEYESLPAVGGGVITRPRIVHSQSVMGLPSDRTSRAASTSQSLRTPTQSRPRPRYTQSNASHLRSQTLQKLEQSGEAPDPVAAWREQQLRQSYYSDAGAGPSRPRAGPSNLRQSYSTADRHLSASSPDIRRNSAQSDLRLSSSSSYTRLSHSSGGPAPTVSTPPSSHIPDEPGSPISPKGSHGRRRSLSPLMIHPFDSLSAREEEPLETTKPTIVLRPHVNNSISHLSHLNMSNHTLSPYTHSVEHFKVRSGPPRTPDLAGQEERPRSAVPPVRARRKRIIHLGGSRKAPEASAAPTRPASPSPSLPSEFSEEVDHYFKDDVGGLRKRSPYDQVV